MFQYWDVFEVNLAKPFSDVQLECRLGKIVLSAVNNRGDTRPTSATWSYIQQGLEGKYQ